MSPSSIPIVSQSDVCIDANDRDQLEVLAQRLLANDPGLNRTDVFGPNVRPGLGDGPSFLFEDHSQISLFSNAEDTPLEYRTLMLAGDGDIMLIGGRRFPDFERYCRDWLGLGHVKVVSPREHPDGTFMPMSKRCIADEELLAEICDLASRHGQLNVIPYIGTGNAWWLAAKIASRSSATIRVAAPPPRLTNRVNDKFWFTGRVREVLDRHASPITYSVFGPAALAGRLKSLARCHERVVVKIPDSAGSLGNVVIQSSDIEKQSLLSLRLRILDILRERGWRGGYPLIVGVWDQPVFASPSVNVWIPAREDGAPVIEGVFTQVLSGIEGEFIGAEICHLPDVLQTRLVREAKLMAHLFQNIGYFGRCGFDAVLVGEATGDVDVHWVECNGRWGGVSIPVTLANRLGHDWRTKSAVIMQRTQLEMPPRTFRSALVKLDDQLLRRPETTTGLVLLAPGRLVDGSGFNFMVLAETNAKAWAMARSVADQLRSSAGT